MWPGQHDCATPRRQEKEPLKNFVTFWPKAAIFPCFATHLTIYVFTSDKTSNVPAWLCVALTNTPFVTCVYYKNKKNGGRIYFCSTNGHYLKDNPEIANRLTPYEVSVDKFVYRAIELHFPTAFLCLRYTAFLTTQIGTSRELNRTSPNNIAEQSTRYVNFNRPGRNIIICVPHWYASANWTKKLLANVAWKLDEWAYRIAQFLGLPPEDARGFLPLETATRVAYTYSAFEWRHIFKLRLLGTTGKPHPNAKIAASLIHEVIIPQHRCYAGADASLT